MRSIFKTQKLGIDLGTVNSLVCNEDKEILVQEPTVAAIMEDTEEVIALGKEALNMVGKTPQNIKIVKPLFSGAIANYTITEQMLEEFIHQAIGKFRLFKPSVAISIPSEATSVEYQAVLDALKSAGAKNGYLVPEPLAAAIGAELPVFSPTGNLIVNSGGGTTEVAVVSLGGIVSSKSIRLAGNKLDNDIINYVRKKHNLIIGSITAEKIKIKIGTAKKVAESKQKQLQVKGRDTASGMPKNVIIGSNEIYEAIEKSLEDLVKGIKEVLENTSAELSSDILDKGMVLTGGTSLLDNLDDFITNKTGIPAVKAENSLFCVINGLGTILKDIEYFERSLIK